MKMLQEAGVDFESVNYYIDPIPKKKLKELLKKMGLPAKEILRKSEPIFKELGPGEKDLPENGLINLMVRYPDLLQRPIVEKGAKAILARPPERLREIL
jgi:arsenate reductase